MAQHRSRDRTRITSELIRALSSVTNRFLPTKARRPMEVLVAAALRGSNAGIAQVLAPARRRHRMEDTRCRLANLTSHRRSS